MKSPLKLIAITLFLGFPGGSDGKESEFSVGDPESIPESGRSPAEGNGNPLQYTCLEILWMEKPGRLKFMGLQRLGHNWVTLLSHSLTHPILISNALL